MNICGCLVHAMPAQRQTVRDALSATQGVEVHAETQDGRFVIVVEDIARKRASETIMDLHQIPGVISLTLTYHHFEEPAPRSPSARIDQPTAGGQTHDHL